jgi:hypothetical protein
MSRHASDSSAAADAVVGSPPNASSATIPPTPLDVSALALGLTPPKPRPHTTHWLRAADPLADRIRDALEAGDACLGDALLNAAPSPPADAETMVGLRVPDHPTRPRLLVVRAGWAPAPDAPPAVQACALQLSSLLSPLASVCTRITGHASGPFTSLAAQHFPAGSGAAFHIDCARLTVVVVPAGDGRLVLVDDEGTLYAPATMDVPSDAAYAVVCFPGHLASLDGDDARRCTVPAVRHAVRASSFASRSSLVLRFYPPTEATLTRGGAGWGSSTLIQTVGSAVSHFRAATTSAVAGAGRAGVRAAPALFSSASSSVLGKRVRSEEAEAEAEAEAEVNSKATAKSSSSSSSSSAAVASTAVTSSRVLYTQPWIEPIVSEDDGEAAGGPSSSSEAASSSPTEPVPTTSSSSSSCSSSISKIQELPRVAPIRSTMQIFVKTFTGKTITIVISPYDTIRYLKAAFFVKEGLPIHLQRFYYGVQQLDDHRTLADYGIRKESTLQILPRLRGD